LPLFATDELARFGDKDNRFDLFATDTTMVFAAGQQRLITVDADLRVAYRSVLPGTVRGLVPLGDGRVLVGHVAGRDTAFGIIERDGRLGATRTFQQLIARSCGPWNTDWLATSGAGFAAIVSCDRQLYRVQIAADLGRAEVHPWSPGLAAAPKWSLDAVSGDTIAVRRDRETTVLAGAPSKLVTRFGFPRIAALDEDDVVVASTVAYRASEHYATSGFVARVGHWRTDLILPHESRYPARIVDVAAAERIVVAIDYRADARVLGVSLPILATSPFPELATRVAVVELERDTGALARVTVLRMPGPIARYEQPRVRATGRHIFVNVEGTVRAFARDGVAVAPGAVPDEPRVHEERELPTIATVAPLAEQWSETCGTHVESRAKDAPCRIAVAAIGKSGVIVAAGGYYQANQLGRRKLPRRAYEAGLLAVYEPDGRLRWHKTLGASWHNDLGDVIVRDDDHIVVLGLHGNHFSIDGKHLPDRELRVVPGQDMGWEANTPYVAIFDPAGKLELLEDLDVLTLGTRSSSRQRTCAGTLARGVAADETWILSTCELASYRLRIIGTSTEPATRIADTRLVADVFEWTLDERGRAFAGWNDITGVELLAVDGAATRRTPVLAAPHLASFSRIAVAPTRVWVGISISDQPRIVLASTELARTIATGPATFEALAVDDHGRPILSIQHDQPLVIAGQTLPPGRTLVRMSADGTRVDRLFVVTDKPGSCGHASAGQVISLAARGGRIAIIFKDGLDPSCGVRDEASTVMVLAPH
jgi:hypothetical protein